MVSKDNIEIVKSIVTIIAVIVGGLWTYNLFVKERQHYPHANISQQISHIKLTPEINLLLLKVEVENTGNSILPLRKSITRVQQILPILPCIKDAACAKNEINYSLRHVERNSNRFSWPMISERKNILESSINIEPDEKETFDLEFVLPSTVKSIRVYNYWRNEKKGVGDNEKGWSASKYYNF